MSDDQTRAIYEDDVSGGGQPEQRQSKAASAGSSVARFFTLLLVAAIAVVATIFVISNLESVPVSFLGYEATLPLWLMILGSLLTGVLLTLLVMSTRAVSRKIRKR